MRPGRSHERPNLDWPGADEIAQRLKTLLPPQLQGQAAGQGAQPAAQVAALQQQIAALQGDQSIQNRKLDIDQFRAETDRMEAVNKGQPR